MGLLSKKNTDTLKWAEKFANLLDSKFKIPGTNFSFGIDPILGLIPVIGDAISLIFEILLVMHLARKGASGKLIALLLINVVLDTLIGSVPLVGQVFDFFYKANERNIRLVKEYHYEGKHGGNGTAIWLGVVLLLCTLIYGLIWALIQILGWIDSLLG